MQRANGLIGQTPATGRCLCQAKDCCPHWVTYGLVKLILKLVCRFVELGAVVTRGCEL